VKRAEATPGTYAIVHRSYGYSAARIVRPHEKPTRVYVEKPDGSEDWQTLASLAATDDAEERFHEERRAHEEKVAARSAAEALSDDALAAEYRIARDMLARAERALEAARRDTHAWRDRREPLAREAYWRGLITADERYDR
jgi:hypothetical protein